MLINNAFKFTIFKPAIQVDQRAEKPRLFSPGNMKRIGFGGASLFYAVRAPAAECFSAGLLVGGVKTVKITFLFLDPVN